jgi:RHS repeat-associated protein
MLVRAVVCLVVTVLAVTPAWSQSVVPGKPRPFACVVGQTCPPNPVTFTFSHPSNTDTSAQIGQTINICASPLGGGDSAKFNGAPISLTISNSCYTSTNTYTLLAGSNTFTAWGCSGPLAGHTPECLSSGVTITHPALAVKPKGGTANAGASVTNTQTFTVSNYMAKVDTFALTLACSGVLTACSTPATVVVGAATAGTVTVSYATPSTIGSTGTLTLTATNSGHSDVGTVNVTVASHLTINTAYTNQEDQDLSRCAVQCFAVTTALSTPAYISRDVPRSVSLLYNSDNVAVRPILSADLTLQPGGPTIKEIQFSALVYVASSASWVAVNFTNSDANHLLHFAAPTTTGVPYRIAGQFDASVLAVNQGSQGDEAVYPMQLMVTAVYSDHQEQFSDSTHHLMLANNRQSPIGNGWGVGGVFQSNWGISGSSGADQHYIMHATTDGSARMYGPFVCSAPGCVWPSPLGQYIGTRSHYDNLPYGSLDYPDSTRENTNPGGYLTMRIGRLQDTTFYGYDSQNRLDSISDPYRLQPGSTHHTFWKLVYGSNGLAQIIEPGADGTPGGGRVTTVTVDGNHLLRSWQDPDGGITSFGYDANGMLDSITDRKGNTTTFAYDAVTRKLVQVTSPSVLVDANSTGSPSATNLVTHYQPWQTVPLPTQPTSSSALANPILVSTIQGTVTAPSGAVTRLTPDRWGQPLLAIDALNDTTASQRDTNGFPLRITYPSGPADLYAYNQAFVTAKARTGGTVINYTYGAFGQIRQVSGAGIATQTFALGARGHVDSTTVDGSTTRFYADAFGRDTLTVDAIHDSTRIGYDTVSGNRDTVLTKASGRYATTLFDGHGRDSVDKVSGAGIATVVSTTLYDSVNRVISVGDAVNRPTTFGYDPLYQTQITDPKNNVYTATYNALGWQTSQTDPTNRTVTKTYTLVGLLASVTNRRNQLTTLTYDAIGRRLKTSRQAVAGEVDAVDSVIYSRVADTLYIANAVSQDRFFFSRVSGFLDSATTAFPTSGQVVKRAYTYDGNLRLISESITQNGSPIDYYTRRYSYDPTTALLDTLTFTAGTGTPQQMLFQYDSLLRTQTAEFLNTDISRTDNYTNTGALAGRSWGGFSTLPLVRNYAYDSAGRIVTVDHGPPLPDTVDSYTYNALGQVTQALLQRDSLVQCTALQVKNGYPCQPPTIQTTTLQTTHFGFDSTGNLDTVLVGSHDTTAMVSPGNRLATWTGLTFAGDSDGNRTSVAGAVAKQYTWSADGRLLSVTSGSTTRTYAYNAFGQVVRRSTNGSVDQYYLWDGDELLAILGPSATSRTAEFVYYTNDIDAPMARITGATGQSIVHLMAQDGIGNIIGEYGPDSTLDQWLAYDPWGNHNVLTQTTDTTQLRWKGVLYEGGATNLYYMRARWYDPATRRFISPDPMGLAAGVNQFAFANGDPINGRDPLGLDPCGDDDPGPIPIVNIPDIPDPGDPVTIADCVVNNYPGGGGFADGGGGGGGGGGGQPPQPPKPKRPKNPKIAFLPPNAFSCTTGTGKQFYAPPQFNLGWIVADGKAGGANPFAMNNAVGHFGTYDYQRSGPPSNFTYYTGYKHVSNIDVGAYLYGAGFGQGTGGAISNAFATLLSSNAGDPDQKTYRDLGYQMAAGQAGGYTCSPTH